MSDPITPSYTLVDATKTALTTGKRPERKLLITVAAWGTVTGGVEANREILGVRTEDSSIEFNLDSETVTDILGTTYTDLNKTEPQQDFDPFNITGGSALAQYLTDAALKNQISNYNQTFTIYIIAAFMYDSTNTVYFAVRHDQCSIYPTSIGGDSYVGIPIEVHLSNKGKYGYVDKLTTDFTFTEQGNLGGADTNG